MYSRVNLLNCLLKNVIFYLNVTLSERRTSITPTILLLFRYSHTEQGSLLTMFLSVCFSPVSVWLLRPLLHHPHLPPQVLLAFTGKTPVGNSVTYCYFSEAIIFFPLFSPLPFGAEQHTFECNSAVIERGREIKR